MDVQCCKCMKTREDSGWAWAKEFKNLSVSYSYCPECLDEFRSDAGLAQRALARFAACA